MHLQLKKINLDILTDAFSGKTLPQLFIIAPPNLMEITYPLQVAFLGKCIPPCRKGGGNYVNKSFCFKLSNIDLLKEKFLIDSFTKKFVHRFP